MSRIGDAIRLERIRRVSRDESQANTINKRIREAILNILYRTMPARVLFNHTWPCFKTLLEFLPFSLMLYTLRVFYLFNCPALAEKRRMKILGGPAPPYIPLKLVKKLPRVFFRIEKNFISSPIPWINYTFFLYFYLGILCTSNKSSLNPFDKNIIISREKQIIKIIYKRKIQ